MPTRPKITSLFAMVVDNREVAVVRAYTAREARDYWQNEHFAVEKLSVSRAFAIGARNEVGIENAKPEYAEEDASQSDLFDDGAALSDASEVSHV
jgi:hypothetical protein